MQYCKKARDAGFAGGWPPYDEHMKHKHGLRERKKQRTRQALVDAALRLFTECGFDKTTVADIAEAADVAPRTFFGYFATKEDVLLGETDDRMRALRTALEERAPGEPLIQVARRAVREVVRQTFAEQSREQMLARAKVIVANPSIQGRLRQHWIEWEEALAEVIAKEVDAAPGDPEPRVVAALITTACRAAVEAVGQRFLTGPEPSAVDPAELTIDRFEPVIDHALGLLEGGLGNYGAGGR